jgi:SAM-dependent methyltransferase
MPAWLATPAGERLLADEAPYVAETARRFHGDTLLWAGCHTPLTDTVRGCMVRNRVFALDGTSPAGEGLTTFRCELDAIPLPNNALDGVFLHHALEMAEDPRTALRELSRVLAAGGRLTVVGFNPFSFWGMRIAYARFFRDSLSGLRLVSPARLVDWLTVLGFELCEEVRFTAYNLPVRLGATADQEEQPAHPLSPSGWAPRLRNALDRHNPPVGGVYMISAVKQALGVRRDWRLSGSREPKLAPVAYPKLSAWNRIERSR